MPDLIDTLRSAAEAARDAPVPVSVQVRTSGIAIVASLKDDPAAWYEVMWSWGDVSRDGAPLLVAAVDTAVAGLVTRRRNANP